MKRLVYFLIVLGVFASCEKKEDPEKVETTRYIGETWYFHEDKGFYSEAYRKVDTTYIDTVDVTVKGNTITFFFDAKKYAFTKNTDDKYLDVPSMHENTTFLSEGTDSLKVNNNFFAGDCSSRKDAYSCSTLVFKGKKK